MAAATVATVWLACTGGDDGDTLSSDANAPEVGGEIEPPTSADASTMPDGRLEAAAIDVSTGNACAPNGALCTLNGVVQALCKGGSCAPCDDLADDAACAAAFAAKLDGGAAICVSGRCVPGDCHVHADCDGGRICGLDAPNTCTGCTADSHCKLAFGTDSVCAISAGGTCVPSAAACTDPDGGACTGSPNDVCCGGSCFAGDCCSDAQCGGASPSCVNHVCTGCPAVTDGNFYVDPAKGNDTSGTGSKGAAGCAFKTISRALAVLGNAQPAPVRVLAMSVVANAAGDLQPLGAGEAFPLVVPANVTLTSEDQAHHPQVDIYGPHVGIILASPNSGTDYFAICGQGFDTVAIIVAQTGSSATTTTVRHTGLCGWSTEGANIVVRDAVGSTIGGALTLGPGFVADGIKLAQHGSAVVLGPQGVFTFPDQTETGPIVVLDSAQITIEGQVSTPPNGNTGGVTAHGDGPGLLIAQTPGAPPTNRVTGLTVWGDYGVADPLPSGVVVLGGSSLVLRGSSLLGNTRCGVEVRPFWNGATAVNDVSAIDLGTSDSPGRNLLQVPHDPLGPLPNKGGGICVELDPNAGQRLAAYGNTLVSVGGASIDCSATAGAVSKDVGACAGASVCIAGPATSTNEVVTLMCTQ